MNIIKQLYPAVVITVLLTLLLGVVYPLVVTGLAQLIFPHQANGSLIEKDGKVVGSELIGQAFTGPGYFHSRPSAAGNGYDAAASNGTDLGPTSQALFDQHVKPAADALHTENPNTPIPVDLVTSSASGLDPDITPAGAEFQIPRVAKERNISKDQARALVRKCTQGRQFGILGEPRVNVLELNLELDRAYPGKAAQNPRQ